MPEVMTHHLGSRLDFLFKVDVLTRMLIFMDKYVNLFKCIDFPCTI